MSRPTTAERVAEYIKSIRPPEPVSPFHILHRWTVWSDPVTVGYAVEIPDIINGLSIGERKFTHNEQYRHCETCGLAQMRRV